MRWFVLRAAGAASLFALALLPSGCGKQKTGYVSGKITLKGAAPNIDGLQLNFLGPGGEASSAFINPDGTYEAAGVPVGTVKVGISVQRPANRPAPPENMRQSGVAPDPKVLAKYEKEVKDWEAKVTAGGLIPEPLRSPGTSGLSVNVEAGKTATFDYDIK